MSSSRIEIPAGPRIVCRSERDPREFRPGPAVPWRIMSDAAERREQLKEVWREATGCIRCPQLASARTGVQFDYLLSQARIESSLNPNAHARTRPSTSLTFSSRSTNTVA